jgi:putative flavoprotein involved in K+ transport
MRIGSQRRCGSHALSARFWGTWLGGGAGSAGLCTAAAFGRRDIPAAVLERGPGVGSPWRHRHEELRLNTDRWLSSLPGFRIPHAAGRWGTRDDYVAHLDAFTARRGL